MFSALVLVQAGAQGLPSSEAVVRTLSALVPAAIEGIVRDVALATDAPASELARIADHAGCEYVEGAGDGTLDAGLAALKEQRILLLRAGRVPEHGYAGELADLAAYRPQQCALLLDAPASFMTRLMPRLSRASGLVAPREALRNGRADVASLARSVARMGASPIVLRARMIGED